MPTGGRYIKIPHHCDEDKDAAWLAQIEMEMSDTPDDFKREILMDETVHGGIPVYSNYHHLIHTPDPETWRDVHPQRKPEIPHVAGSVLFGGWDCGQTLTPAFTLEQVEMETLQVQILLEVTSGGGESMEEFAPRVLAAVMHRIPDGWDEIRHYGDSTVTTRGGAKKTSAQDEAKKHGLNITPVSNAWAPRYAAVSWLLKRRLSSGEPGLVIDASNCPMLVAGFQGAYKYKVSASGELSGPGAVLMEPLKNLYSHVQDSLQYPAIHIRQLLEGKPARRPFRSKAGGYV